MNEIQIQMGIQTGINHTFAVRRFWPAEKNKGEGFTSEGG